GFTISNGVTFTKAGTVDTFNIYPTTAGVSLMGLIYSDNAGQPGNLLGQTALINIPTANTWYQTPILTPVNVNAGNYWIAFQINSDVAGPAKDSLTWARMYIASVYGRAPYGGATWQVDGGAKDSMY